MYQEEEEEKKDEVSMVTWHEHDVNNLNQNPCPFIPATIKLNILSCDIYFQTLSLKKKIIVCDLVMYKTYI